MSADLNLRPLSLAFREGDDYRVTESGCWEWLRYINPSGYGECRRTLGERLAHRASYAMVNGRLTPGDGHVHHVCENKRCINPAHLEHHSSSDHRRIHRQAESTLTWDDVNAIRAANKAGVRLQELSERYGLRMSTLHKLIANGTWIDPDYVPGVEKACEQCGEAFRTTKVNKRFCQRRCQERWNSPRTSAAYKARQRARKAA